MAPTIQTGHRSDIDKRQRANADKKSELVCRVKYCNTLPDIPFDPKFITYPFESNRFVQYNPTSLERNYKHDLLTEHDLGVPIDLINSDTYAIIPSVILDPADEKLLEEEIVQPTDSKRSRHHAKSVSWLRRTEYISTEYTRFQPSTEKTETKVGYNVKRYFKEQDLYMDRESQIKEIDKTFDDSKLNIEKHHTKPFVTPVEVLSVFPDFDMWKYPCAQVIFDSDPAPMGRPLPAQLEEMSQAMIRGVMDESGEQFVAYFLPTEDTLTKRKQDVDNSVDYVDEEEYDYKMAREYNWNVKNKASKGYEENYFFVFRSSGVYYNELETRVRLSKRRLKPGTQPNNSRLVVRHRPLNEPEFKTQEVRMMQLEPQQEEEEEEEQQDLMETEEKNEDIDDDDETPVPAKRRRRIRNDNEDSEEEQREDKDNEASENGKESASEKEESEKEEDDEEEQKESGDEASENEAGSDREEEEKPANQASGDEEEERSEKEESEAEEEAEEKKQEESSKSDSSSSSSESSDEESGSEKSSSSDSESEAEEDKKKRDEEEIFGSGSDSD